MSYRYVLIQFSFFLFISCSSQSTSNNNSVPNQENSTSTINNEKADEEVNESYNENGDEDALDSDFNINSDDTESDEPEDSYPDDVYCADVEYHNPHSGASSSYTLTIEVENHEIVKINFPSGWLDIDQFDAAELGDDGNASFTSDRGYEYEVQIIGKEAGCFTNVPRAVQCRGITEDGEQCEHLTDNLNGLCWMHQDQE